MSVLLNTITVYNDEIVRTKQRSRYLDFGIDILTVSYVLWNEARNNPRRAIV